MKLRRIIHSISLATASTLIATLVAPTAALAAGPTNTALPTISGTLAVDQTVIAGSGSWDITPSSITYQWNRCSTTEITSCVQITGANTSALKLLPADGGNFLRLQVTALSAGGGTTASSAISGRVLTQPTASAVPVITGVVQVGSTLTISNVIYETIGEDKLGELNKEKKPFCPPMNFCKLDSNFEASHKLDSDEIVGFNNDSWNEKII